MSVATIQLQDFGALPKLGLKGPAAASWLRQQGVDLPAEVLAVGERTDGGWIARLGITEFLLEQGGDGDFITQLERCLHSLPSGVYRVPRCDVTMLLSGSEVQSVFAQTCGIDFRRTAPHRIVYTRVAGVSCCIFPESSVDARFRLWVDYTFAQYLWDALAGIVSELGGESSRLNAATVSSLAEHT
jgi:sarcosine oxidase subunit gamma